MNAFWLTLYWGLAVGCAAFVAFSLVDLIVVALNHLFGDDK